MNTTKVNTQAPYTPKSIDDSNEHTVSFSTRSTICNESDPKPLFIEFTNISDLVKAINGTKDVVVRIFNRKSSECTWDDGNNQYALINNPDPLIFTNCKPRLRIFTEVINSVVAMDFIDGERMEQSLQKVYLVSKESMGQKKHEWSFDGLLQGHRGYFYYDPKYLEDLKL
jgi:hypothetical protein